MAGRTQRAAALQHMELGCSRCLEIGGERWRHGPPRHRCDDALVAARQQGAGADLLRERGRDRRQWDCRTRLSRACGWRARRPREPTLQVAASIASPWPSPALPAGRRAPGRRRADAVPRPQPCFRGLPVRPPAAMAGGAAGHKRFARVEPPAARARPRRRCPFGFPRAARPPGGAGAAPACPAEAGASARQHDDRSASSTGPDPPPRGPRRRDGGPRGPDLDEAAERLLDGWRTTHRLQPRSTSAAGQRGAAWRPRRAWCVGGSSAPRPGAGRAAGGGGENGALRAGLRPGGRCLSRIG